MRGAIVVYPMYSVRTIRHSAVSEFGDAGYNFFVQFNIFVRKVNGGVSDLFEISEIALR